MKLIIAGSRNLKPPFGFIDFAVKEFARTFPPSDVPFVSHVVSGQADGVDREGEHWASHAEVPVRSFPADWKKHGKAAGPIRNAEMAKCGDALLLIWDGESRGSASMKREMEKQKKPVFEVIMRRVQ